MPIRYRCPACEQLLGVSSKMVGRTFDCPTCGVPSIVPAANDEVAALVQPAEPAESIEAPHDTIAEDDDSNENQHAADAVDEVAADAGGFTLSRLRVDEEEMDLTPMVDMTFLLLIFFMITASFSVQKSIEFPPPDPDQKGAAQSTLTLDDFEDNSVVVRVDDRNAIYVDDERLTEASHLVDILRKAMSARRNEVVLSADEGAWHETVVKVIDAATASGMQKIRMAVYKDD